MKKPRCVNQQTRFGAFSLLTFSQHNTTNTTNNCFSLWLLQHVLTHESSSGYLRTTEHFRILTVLFVLKAADPCVSSGRPSVEQLEWLQGPSHTTHLHLMPRLSMSTAIPPLPQMPSWHVQGQQTFRENYSSPLDMSSSPS
jgi:hypothetical protein